MISELKLDLLTKTHQIHGIFSNCMRFGALRQARRMCDCFPSFYQMQSRCQSRELRKEAKQSRLRTQLEKRRTSTICYHAPSFLLLASPKHAEKFDSGIVKICNRRRGRVTASTERAQNTNTHRVFVEINGAARVLGKVVDQLRATTRRRHKNVDCDTNAGAVFFFLRSLATRTAKELHAARKKRVIRKN